MASRGSFSSSGGRQCARSEWYPLSLSHTHTHILAHSMSLSLSHTHTLTITHTHTHAHTLTCIYGCALARSGTLYPANRRHIHCQTTPYPLPTDALSCQLPKNENLYKLTCLYQDLQPSPFLYMRCQLLCTTLQGRAPEGMPGKLCKFDSPGSSVVALLYPPPETGSVSPWS